MFNLEEHNWKEDRQRSEAIEHFKDEETMSAEKCPDNYQPSWNERDEQKRPREIFSMKNSYGDVAIAANRKKEMTLIVSANRRHNGKTLNNDYKKLNGEQRHFEKDFLGEFYTNSHNPINSAVAFKTRKFQPENRFLDSIGKYVNKKGQDTLESMLPFLTLGKDKKRLQKLEGEVRKAKEKGQNFYDLEGEKENLAQDIVRKEQMQALFSKKMRLAIIKARVITDYDRAKQFTSFLQTNALENPDTSQEDIPPVDDKTDILAGLLDPVVQGKKPK